MFKCKDCKDRHYNCWAECSSYQEERKKLDAINEKRKKEEKVREYFVDKSLKVKRSINNTKYKDRW